MEFKKLMETRRSANFFDSAKPVSDEQLRVIVDTARLVPSSFNLQPWNLIVVRSAKDKARLRKLANDQPKVTEAPVVLIVLADKEGYAEANPTVQQVWQSMEKNGYARAEQKGWFFDVCEKMYSGDPTALAFAVKNTALFAMALMLAAKDIGLDTHPMDGFNREGIMKEFSIPQNFFVVMLIAVGYFDQRKKLLPRNWRKSYDEIVLSTLA
jgi:nitroreductase